MSCDAVKTSVSAGSRREGLWNWDSPDELFSIKDVDQSPNVGWPWEESTEDNHSGRGLGVSAIHPSCS